MQNLEDTTSSQPYLGASTEFGKNRTVSMTKDELRAELERQKQRFEEVYGGEVVTYAAQPGPERKPWKKRPSLLDEAFAEEIRKEEKRQADLPR